MNSPVKHIEDMPPEQGRKLTWAQGKSDTEKGRNAPDISNGRAKQKAPVVNSCFHIVYSWHTVYTKYKDQSRKIHSVFLKPLHVRLRAVWRCE